MDDLATLAAHLRSLEEELLRPEIRRSRAELEARLDPDFVEFGTSGRVYDREASIGALAAEVAAPRAIVENLAVRLLAPDVALVTYRSRGAGDARGARPRAANRCSIWRREGTTWRLAFHQGTPAD